MNFGLSDEEYDFISVHVVAPLSKYGAKVWCFGSRARGDFKKFSDLDLMIENGQHLESVVSSIREFLSNSNFPFKVDLVQLSDFAQSYRENYEHEKKPF
jgi:predicted nucleotidyltransferase